MIGSLKRSLRSLFHTIKRTKRTNNRVRDGSASMTVEQEQVKPYDHPQEGLVDDEIHLFRTKQLAFRANEVSATIDLLDLLNKGHNVPANLWKLMHPSALPGQAALLESLVGSIDCSRVVIAGHSFGAATAFYAAHKDHRISAAITMDPWMFPLPRPFDTDRQIPLLIINSENFHWNANLTALKALLDRNVELGSKLDNPHASMMVTLKGTGHMDQSDFTVALPSYVTDRFRPGQTADPAGVLRTNNDIILAFLKYHCNLQPGYEAVPFPKTKREKVRYEQEHNVTLDYIKL